MIVTYNLVCLDPRSPIRAREIIRYLGRIFGKVIFYYLVAIALRGSETERFPDLLRHDGFKHNINENFSREC